MNTSYTSQYFNRADEEDFLQFESKVDQVLKMLEDMSNAQKNPDDEVPEERQSKVPPSLTDNLDQDDFIVSIKSDRTSINRKSITAPESAAEIDKFTFMQQMEEDADRRAKTRQQQQEIAQNFRKLGNDAFRQLNFEKAIDLYTKAIEHVKNSPILYTNRALCYFKLRNFKRSLIDCDYVLMKLDEKNLRAWMYRAACYKRLVDEHNYEASIRYCKKHNPKKHSVIDDFVNKIREM